MKNYNLFLGPELFNANNIRQWTSKEAKAYFDWLMNVKNERVQNFCLFLFNKNTLQDSLDIGEIADEVLNRVKEFSILKDGKIVPDGTGLSISADFGLYIAEYCIKRKSDLKWGIVKGQKTDISYNLPAIFKENEQRDYVVEPIGLTIRRIRFMLNNPDSEDNSFWQKLVNGILTE